MTEGCGIEEETLYSLFCKSYVHHLDDVAVVEDSGIERRHMTYSELYDASNDVSHILSDIVKGTKLKPQFIAICMEQNLAFPAVVIGILSKGFGFAMVDCSWPEDKQRKLIHKLGCPCLIRSATQTCLWPDSLHSRLSIKGHVIFVDYVGSYTSKISRKCVHSMAYAVRTSGSTGEPKIVRVPHASILPNICDLKKKFNINSKDVIFLSSPSTFDPSVIDMFLALTSGAKLLVTPKSIKASPENLLKVLFPQVESCPGVSFLQITPSVFSRWSEKDIRETILGALSPLRVLLLGGEPCFFLPKLMGLKGSLNKTEVYTIYGITEVSAWASLRYVESTHVCTSNVVNDLGTSEIGGTCLDLGYVLTDTCFEVRDVHTGSVLSEGIGELYIGSHTRMCEVDSENCLDFSPPVYRFTGDIVKISNGSFSYIGRKDWMVKRWGQRVSLQSVERLAISHEDISSACCVWDERKHLLSLFVKTTKPMERAAIQRHFLISTKGEDILIPDEIYFVDDLPIDHHGKVNRNSLLEKVMTGPVQVRKVSKLDPSTVPAKEFIKQWCYLLGIQYTKQLNPEESFASSGGNSLQALRLSNYLEDRFGSVPQDLVSLLLSNNTFDFCVQRITNFYNIDCPKGSTLSSTYEDTFHYATVNKNDQTCQGHHSFVPETSDTKLVLSSALGMTEGELMSSISSGKISDSFCEVPKEIMKMSKKLNISVSWKTDVEKCVDASPLCLHYKSGMICVVIGSHSGKFVAIDGSTGVVKWSILLPDRIESTACSSLCGQFVYVGCYDGRLYCILVSTGEIHWHFQTEGMIKCSPVLCNRGNNILFGSYDHYVYCVSAKTGDLLWKGPVISPSGSWLASPLVTSSTAILCSLAAKIAAVDTTTGKVMWLKSTESPIFASPILLPKHSFSLVVFAEVCGKLHCLCSSTGKEVWSWALANGSHIFSTPSCVAFKEEPSCLILFGSHDSSVYCLHMNSELEVSLNWKATFHSPVVSTPFPFVSNLAADVFYVVAASSSGKVIILNLKDGSIEAQHQLPFEVYSSPLSHDFRVYVGCRDDHVYCLSLNYDCMNEVEFESQ